MIWRRGRRGCPEEGRVLWIGGLSFSFHPVTVGSLALLTARGNRDLWALDVLDYGENEWLFAVESKEQGEKLLKYLDRYFMI